MVVVNGTVDGGVMVDGTSIVEESVVTSGCVKKIVVSDGVSLDISGGSEVVVKFGGNNVETGMSVVRFEVLNGVVS